MTQTPRHLVVKTALAAFALLLAALRFFFAELAKTRMDSTFLLLIAASALVFVIPWDRLKTFKAGTVELTIDMPQVRGALEALGFDRVQSQQLRNQLSNLASEIPQLKGSRVLWIDDKPHTVVGERRLLRSLGIEIVTATSSAKAEETLEADNDFDLIITDVQRQGESYKLNDGVPIHEGVNFIVKLRKHDDDGVRSLPVIFYAAYDWERLVKFTRSARELFPEAEISNAIDVLLPKLIRMLALSRSSPIAVSKQKPGTFARP